MIVLTANRRITTRASLPREPISGSVVYWDDDLELYVVEEVLRERYSTLIFVLSLIQMVLIVGCIVGGLLIIR